MLAPFSLVLCWPLIAPLSAAPSAILPASPGPGPVAGATAPSGGDEIPDPVDSVTLNQQDKVLKGRIVRVESETIWMHEGRRLREVPRDQVDSYIWCEDAHRKLLAPLHRAQTGTAEELLILANQFDSYTLAGEARIARTLALLKQPDLEAAHEGLGHLKRKGEWRVKQKGRWVPWRKSLERNGKWSDALEVCTLHFVVRSNMPVETVLRAALDAEQMYRHFYDTLGKEFELLQSPERLAIHLHGDLPSFPGPGVSAHMYTEDAQLVSIAAHQGYRPGLLVQPMVRQMLVASATTAKGRMAVPVWLYYGLGRHFGAQLGIQSEKYAPLLFDAARPNTYDREFHRSAEQPLDFQRVLTLGESAYFGANRDLFYSQSGSLVDFCLNGESGRWREGFLEFLAGALDGRGSSTRFKKSLGMKDKDFQAAWEAHVGI